VSAARGFLIDENLPPSLAVALRPLYPHSVHVRDVFLESSSDTEIWNYALANDLAILSRDSDFHQRSFVFGHPPKVVWLRIGNCSTSDLLAILRDRQSRIMQFFEESDSSYLVIERANRDEGTLPT